MGTIRSHQVLSVLALGLLSGACGDPGPPVLRISVSPTPPTTGEARVIVAVPDSVLPVSEVVVRARRADDGSVAERAAEASGPGLFAVPDFPFPTAGHWRLVVDARLPDGRRLRDSADVRVVGSDGTP